MPSSTPPASPWLSLARKAFLRLFGPPEVPEDASPEVVGLVLRQIRAENHFISHLGLYLGACLFFVMISFVTGAFAAGIFPIMGWGLAIWMHAAATWLRSRRTAEKRMELEAAARSRRDAPPPPDELHDLREKLIATAEEARATVRAGSPQAATMIAQGETRALRLMGWLSDAEREVGTLASDRALRKEVASRLSDPKYRRDRERLTRLLEDLDRRDAALSSLERVAGERRARLESFLLALETAKRARPETHLLESVAAPLSERVALLDAPRSSASGQGPDADVSRIAEEVRLARELQRSIMPERAPDVPGLSVAQVYRPSSEVGGDFYDFYARDGKRLLVALGDASGHGIDSSMIGSMAKSALYLQVSAGRGLTDALAELNRMMADTLGRRRLMTMVLCEIDPESRELAWVNAGQVFPMIVRAGRVTELEQPGYPLGVRRNVTYQVRMEELEPGDLVVMVTDGVPEALGSGGEPYGWERLARCLSRLPESCAAGTAVEMLTADLASYLGTAVPQDDVTMIAVSLS
ncbi:MAG: SpoIIE family protein phosphatase [Acidobacteriota bacterium]